MNAAATRWVAALRNGIYKQGTNSLSPTSDTFCCLGVASELYRKEKKVSKRSVFNHGFEQCQNIDLTVPVMKWLGLNSQTGSFNKSIRIKKEVCHSLADLNDTGKWDFKKIADFIEGHPKGLFIEEDV